MVLPYDSEILLPDINSFLRAFSHDLHSSRNFPFVYAFLEQEYSSLHFSRIISFLCLGFNIVFLVYLPLLLSNLPLCILHTSCTLQFIITLRICQLFIHLSFSLEFSLHKSQALSCYPSNNLAHTQHISDNSVICKKNEWIAKGILL